jgi:hypothetical protein
MAEETAFGCTLEDLVTMGLSCRYTIGRRQVKGKEVTDLLSSDIGQRLLEGDFLRSDKKRILSNIHKDQTRESFTPGRGIIPNDVYQLFSLYEQTKGKKRRKKKTLVGLALVRKFEIGYFRDLLYKGDLIRLLSKPKECLQFESQAQTPFRLNREIFFITAFHFAPWCYFLFTLISNYHSTHNTLWLRLDPWKSRTFQCQVFHVLKKRFGGYPFYYESEKALRPVHWQFPTSSKESLEKDQNFDIEILKRAKMGLGQYEDDYKSNPNILERASTT